MSTIYIVKFYMSDIDYSYSENLKAFNHLQFAVEYKNQLIKKAIEDNLLYDEIQREYKKIRDEYYNQLGPYAIDSRDKHYKEKSLKNYLKQYELLKNKYPKIDRIDLDRGEYEIEEIEYVE